MFKFKKSKSVSLIIKDHVIRYAMMNHNDITDPLSSGEKYLPTGVIRDGKIIDRDRLVMILEECVDEWGLRRKDVHFIVPDAHVFFRELSIPTSIKKEEIKGYLFMELGNSIPLPFANPFFDYVTLDNVDNGKKILLFAAPEPIIQEYVSVLEEAKINPVSIEINALAMYRLLFTLDRVDPKEHLMFIEFDVDAVGVSIFHQHKPKYVHHLVNAGHVEQFEIEESQEMVQLHFTGDEMILYSDLQDTIGEIERILNFYKYSLHKGEAEVSHLVLTGDHPYIKHIYNQMNESLPIKLESATDLFNEAGFSIAPRYLTTMGLALKEVPK
ncbi:type IV pilus biogenesis protein PilM [Bacillus suaedae]|uniref:Pilus assembly protein PilM n=1 Tax=Halalkalibacter suaedae TaxID=2822140 RepID=A0A940WNU0_9BACI|nr:pilus assembly protein PilM [Bacillus suaedae]MBP3949651.1 pilus assembly protein PilM [Bacillus suaedae]